MDKAVTAGGALSACDSLFALETRAHASARGGQYEGWIVKIESFSVRDKKKLNPFISLQTQSERRHFLSALRTRRLPL